MVTTWWSPQLNALLGSLVVAAGAWLAWDSFSPWGVFLVAGGVAGFLIWQGRKVGLVWAWATLLLGLESLAWPIVTMVQVRSTTTEPTDEQMGTILSAVVTGLLSAIFWITISYGLFKRTGQPITVSSTDATDSHPPTPPSGRLRKHRSDLTHRDWIDVDIELDGSALIYPFHFLDRDPHRFEPRFPFRRLHENLPPIPSPESRHRRGDWAQNSETVGPTNRLSRRRGLCRSRLSGHGRGRAGGESSHPGRGSVANRFLVDPRYEEGNQINRRRIP